MEPSYIYLVTSPISTAIKLGVARGDNVIGLRDHVQPILGPHTRFLLYETPDAHAIETAFRRQFKPQNISLRLYDKAHAAEYEAYLASASDRCRRVAGLGAALHPPANDNFSARDLADALRDDLPMITVDGASYIGKRALLNATRDYVERLSLARYHALRRELRLRPESYARASDITTRKYMHLISKLFEHTHDAKIEVVNGDEICIMWDAIY